jgi:hypothetical protein
MTLPNSSVPRPLSADSSSQNPPVHIGHRWEIVFDILFGIIIPILLLRADPVLLFSRFFINGCWSLAGSYALFIYLAIGTGILTLLIWLLVPSLRQRFPVFFVTVFVMGAVFALGIGLLLLPINAHPIQFAICGLLGLIPVLSAFVYLRKAFRAQQSISGNTKLIPSMVVAITLVIGIPAFLQVHTANAIRLDVLSVDATDERPRTRAVNTLSVIRSVCLGLCDPMIIDAFKELRRSGSITEEQFRLTAAAFEQITGRDRSDLSCNILF